jgi:maltooligosyltrehalose trehalohydrolase
VKTFQVWAPQSQSVEVLVSGTRHEMTRSATGWWSAKIETAQPGDDYGFFLDNEGPYPDPRSPWQPHGVHRLSRLVNSESFQWSDTTWQAPPLPRALIYELHIGTFTSAGTFLSAIEKLDHLLNLGVTHVEIMPVGQFSGRHGWGYDGVDLFAPHQAYGDPDDLKALVNACHLRGLAVILDVVYNHLGPSGNYLGKFGPYFTKKFASPWGEGINFDGPESDEVRRFFCDNALMWLRDFHFDGLRLDAIHGIIDTSAIHFLEQLKCEVEQLAKAIGRPLVLIPESDLNDPRILRPRTHGGYELDAQWSDDFHHALHTILTGEKSGYYSDYGRLEHLAKAWRHVFVYDGNYSAHRRRNHGRSVDGLHFDRFLGYLQNHDQIGNRAKGERSGGLMSAGKLKIGAAVVLMAPFIPMLFQGEAWGALTPFYYFTDYEEPELAAAVRAGRCREFAMFGWKPEDTPDPQAAETFKRSKLNWSEIKLPSHQTMLAWHRQLIQLRKTEPALQTDISERTDCRLDEDQGWISLERGPISIACNLASRAQQVFLREGEHELLLASEVGVNVGKGMMLLPSESVAITRLVSS